MHQALVESNKASMVLLPLLRNNGTTASKFVDMAGWENVDFLIQVGATDTTVDAKAQESDNADGSSASDIAGAAITQISATDDNRMAVISVKRSIFTKQYAGISVVVGNGTTGANVSIVAVRYGGNGETYPVTQEAAGSNTYVTAEVVKV